MTNTSYAAEGHGSLLVLALLALIVGAAAGLVGAIFRLTLQQADRLRDALIAWAQGEKLAGFLIVVVTCAAAVLIAAWLVRRFSPHASGSGIPHVEAVLNEEILQAPFHLIWVKFCGGVLAIGSGLALGREGPSVQMGASVGHLVGNICRREWPDCRALLAAGAGAGLATAFNAPMAGAVFVLEELVRRFEFGIAVAALGTLQTGGGPYISESTPSLLTPSPVVYMHDIRIRRTEREVVRGQLFVPPDANGIPGRDSVL